VFAVAIAATLALAGQAQAQQPCGDVNGSGAVDPGDVVVLNLRTVTGVQASDCKNNGTVQCGDIDQRPAGTIDLSDVLALLNRLANNEPLFFCKGGGTLITCGATITGNISSNITIQDCGGATSALLDGIVIVQPGVTVTVQPGAVVKGISPTTGTSTGDASVLLVSRGGKLNAPGTSADPIVFTSDLAPGSRSIGDWGGIVINGEAPVNFEGGVGSSEGFPVGFALFGGTKANSNSGIFTFLRVEFSGVELSPDNELNVFTQNGVGAGTLIEHVQANAGFDDCLEWFGGNVKTRYMVASNCRDDNIDSQIGWTGSIQYALVVQNAAIANDSAGRHGFEWDNNENGLNNTPRSNPNICNVTAIGARNQTGGSGLGADGARLRRGTAGKIYNTIIAGWSGDNIDLRSDGGTTCTQATTGNLAVCESLSFNNADDTCDDECGAAACNAFLACGLLQSTDPAFLATPFGDAGLPATAAATIDGRYFPANGGAADDSEACPLDPSFMDPVEYIGAFDPNADPATPGDAANWLLTTGGWISFATN
jgi:hypothetical protein